MQACIHFEGYQSPGNMKVILLLSCLSLTTTTKFQLASKPIGPDKVKPGYELSEPALPSFVLPPGRPCPDKTYDIPLPAYGKTVHIHHEEKTWCDAQKFCQGKYGGSLWEPQDSLEYAAVKSQAIALNSALSTACKWWIGVLNWSNNNGRDGVFASETNYLRTCPREPSIKGAPFTWKQITDGGDGNSQNCVDIRGSAWSWGDERCSSKRKFICEEMKASTCDCELNCKQVKSRGNSAYCPAGSVATSCSCGHRCGSWNLLSNGCYCHKGCMDNNRPLDWTAATCCKLT